jgi:hypothetical protein
MSDLPNDIVESLLRIGRVEWGCSFTQTDEQHIEDFRDTLRITREHFGDTEDATAIHGVYLEGSKTVLCHTGPSPNSPQHARILVGAWNQLFELAQAQKGIESGANAAADNSAPDTASNTTTRIIAANGGENV